MRRFLVGCLIGTSLTSLPAMAAETVRYVYDAQGRLVKVERTVGASPTVTTDYEHDRANNRKRVKVTGSTNTP